MKKWLKAIFISVFMINIQVFAQIAPPELPVKSYILLDATTGQVLAEKNANQPLPPASITKLMTAYVVFNALKTGQIHLDDIVTISNNAYTQSGSRMFLEPNSKVSVNDLITGMIVQSGNDASVALAEYIGGSVGGFVQIMNQDAQKLGLKNTHYMNVTGLPIDEHYSTANDIAILARAIIQQFPEYYHYYSQKEFTWNKIKQSNRNRLLWRNPNVDGMKTGHTDAAGYCLTASEKRDNMRLITVVLGAEKEAERYDAAQALLNYGFAQFSSITALTAMQNLGTTKVYKGEQENVGFTSPQTVTFLVPNIDRDKVQAVVKLNAPLIAPIAKGQTIGTITINIAGKPYQNIPAVAAENIPEAGFFSRTWDGIKLWWNE